MVTGGGAGTSRLRRVLAVGAVGCAQEGATCSEVEVRDLLGESAFRLLTLTLLKLREWDSLPESATKEKEWGEAWAAVERAANGLPAHMLRDGCVPHCVKMAVKRACARAFMGNESAAGRYYGLALAYLERRARERAASSHAGTAGRVLPEPTHTSPQQTRACRTLSAASRSRTTCTSVHLGRARSVRTPLLKHATKAKERA